MTEDLKKEDKEIASMEIQKVMVPTAAGGRHKAREGIEAMYSNRTALFPDRPAEIIRHPTLCKCEFCKNYYEEDEDGTISENND